ncbi:serine protease inhibitor Kazal-type 5 isoform X1 [Alligator mississippiensis]|uniref:serine protease inhibitor Kazal-type 5 isoform X1 n=1 Tax=Alligator mississippiensis TaxID=8496 RepID=UPI00071171D3|nr:serine protease inhibitor Kazal-type 5 isoform X1 [Alligator mississippiensis]
MKIAGVFVLPALAFFCFFSDVASQKWSKFFQDHCKEYHGISRTGAFYCNRINSPVRGPDGKTHLNQCLMCKKLMGRGLNNAGSGGEGNGKESGSRDSSGKIDCSEYEELFKSGHFSCTKENDPVRDSLGKEHSNKCLLCAARYKKENGLNSTQNSPGEFVGVKVDCSAYEEDFKSGTLSCTRESDPVRDSSGKEHNNKCVLCAERFKKDNGMTKEDEDECSEYRSQIRNGGKLFCTRELNPVRDASGREHPNKCYMCADKFKKEAQNGGRPRVSSQSSQNGCGGSGSQQGEDGRPSCPSARPGCGGSRGVPGQSGGGCGQDDKVTQAENREAQYKEELQCNQLLYGVKGGRIFCRSPAVPVCGTDGKTYSNRCQLCFAARQSASSLSLRHVGKCTSPAETTK